MADAATRLAVLGLGNTLLGDDGVGPVAVSSFAAQHDLPPEVRVEDLGTPGLDLTPYLLGVDAVLFVDAVTAGYAAGTVSLLDRDALLGSTLSPRVSPHDPGVQQALQIVELCEGRRIDASVLGVEPQDLSLGTPLSACVEARIPELHEAIRQWLAARGAAPHRPSEPQ